MRKTRNSTLTGTANSSGNSDKWPDGSGMIYLAMSPWDGMWKNRHQLMSRFAQTMPVIYVEPPIRLKRLRRKNWLSGSTWQGFSQPKCYQVNSGLHVFKQSNWLPVSDSKRLASFTKRRWLNALKSSINRAGIEKPILWITIPEQHFALTEFKEIFSIYHIVDEYSGYTSDNLGRKKRMRALEQTVLDDVDLSIVVSPELQDSKSAPAREIVLVENGVDIKAYNSVGSNMAAPNDTVNIPRPCLGYSGLIGKRLDLNLMIELAEAKSDWSLVFVGSVDERDCRRELAHLEKLPNVFFLGEKPAHEVANYISSFDIGLLPYSINTETMHISPLKMYEYFAAGIPVVATPIPAAERYADEIILRSGSKLFIQGCETALKEDDDSYAKTRRQDLASKNTWEHRVNQISDIVMVRIDKKLSSLGQK